MIKKENLPILPLKNSVVFPGGIVPLVVARVGSLQTIKNAASRADRAIVILTQRTPGVENPTANDIYKIGTKCTIRNIEHIGEGSVHLIVVGLERVELLDAIKVEAGLFGEFQTMQIEMEKGPEVDAFERSIREMVERAEKIGFSVADVPLSKVVAQESDPLKRAYLICSLFGLSVEKCQQIIEASQYSEVLRLLFEALSYEIQVIEMKSNISMKTASKIGQDNREFILRQQLRTIQKELGDFDPVASEIAEFNKQLSEKNLPEHARKEVHRELEHLKKLSPSAPDYHTIRSYIELVIELPWEVTEPRDIELSKVKEKLDRDHHALDDVKTRIIEYLAVQKLNPKAKTPIFCFVGPPGVGKTSLGHSIAEALGRKFERASLGGVSDESELRGHRRTYIGAMPGRIIQAIRRARVLDPVIMLDEIDKLGRDFRGDPAAALLEILDPQQNTAFHDNYLDIAYDLSKVFFITTANIIDTIPKALVDRMEVLRLSGYSDREKQAIAKEFLLPKQLENAGLTGSKIRLTGKGLNTIIRNYTRESGVRELDRNLNKVISKIALRIANEEKFPSRITDSDVIHFLGPKKYLEEIARYKSQPGIAPGLAWTEAGGEVLYVEAAFVLDRKSFILTGHLGDIMKESALTAKSCVLNAAKSLGIKEKYLRRSLHIHVPAGSIPKDGPSAGVTIAMAILSLVANQAIDPLVGMTGEISLVGMILPVGGIKEKILAAHRVGMRKVILPAENRKDLLKLPKEVLDHLEFVFVKTLDELIKNVFPELHRNRHSSNGFHGYLEGVGLEATVVPQLEAKPNEPV